MRYRLVGDNSGHEYYIPIDRTKEWAAFNALSDDDPASWTVPTFAVMIDGTFTFAEPRCEAGW